MAAVMTSMNNRLSATQPHRRCTVKTTALFRSSKSTVTLETKSQKAAKDDLKSLNKLASKQKQEDADLLYQAKFGARGADGKMSREQYAALRRKIGGTARDYFKDYIQPDVREAYMKPSEGTQVPGLAFLVAVVVALMATTAFVVSSV